MYYGDSIHPLLSVINFSTSLSKSSSSLMLILRLKQPLHVYKLLYSFLPWRNKILNHHINVPSTMSYVTVFTKFYEQADEERMG